MVRLPFSCSIGPGSLLNTLIESDVPVDTFGSKSIHAMITYKWRKFAQKETYTKTILYLTFVLLYTAYAIVLRCVCLTHVAPTGHRAEVCVPDTCGSYWPSC